MLKENERFDQLIKEDLVLFKMMMFFIFNGCFVLGVQNLEQKILCWTYVQAMG